MKHRKEASIYQLIDNIKNGYQVVFVSKGSTQLFPLQCLLAGALGLGAGLAGLCWSLRDGYLFFPWASDQKEPSDEVPVTVAGLRNLGNNCFLNCILQSLASSRCFLPFLQNVMSLDDAGDEQKVETLPLVISLTSLLEELCLVRDKKTVVNPRSVMLAMAQYTQGFNLMRQQDAAEAFIHLLSSLEKEITEHYIQLQHDGSLVDITALSCRIHNQDKGAPNELNKWKKLFIGPFDAVIGSYLTCQTCSTMLSLDLEFLRALPLSPVLDKHAGIMEGCSLLDCLKHFTKVESVDNYRCSRCWHTAALKHLSYRTEKDEVKIKRLSDCVKHDSCGCENLFCDEEISWTGISHALKKLSIIKCPKVLSFHLQRASMNCHGELVKLPGHISFPLFLDLSTFVETGTKMGQLTSLKYRLNNTKVQDCAFVPPVGDLLKQLDMGMLPHLYRIVGQNSSVPSGELSGNRCLEVPSVGNSDKVAVTELGADLNPAFIFPKRSYHEKVEISSSRTLQSGMYYLCSVVEHYGRPGSGHYAVYRKVVSSANSMNGLWVYISDTKVQYVNEEDVLAAEASMLFYEKVEDDIHENQNLEI